MATINIWGSPITPATINMCKKDQQGSPVACPTDPSLLRLYFTLTTTP